MVHILVCNVKYEGSWNIGVFADRALAQQASVDYETKHGFTSDYDDRFMTIEEFHVETAESLSGVRPEFNYSPEEE